MQNINKNIIGKHFVIEYKQNAIVKGLNIRKIFENKF